nr:SOS response-associated peptidase [uncultured Lachnoclostridium sp.]
MCGRFYIDDELKEELDQLLRELDSKSKEPQKSDTKSDIKRQQAICSGEVYPTNEAVILTKDIKHAEYIKWGYPSWQTNQVIFNARSETVLQKRMFERGFLENRCIIPASGFFEWDRKKKKYFFWQKGERVMYLGGIFDVFQGKRYFTILTREPNQVMRPIHDRMPLIISHEKADVWLHSFQDARKMLYETQPEMEAELAKKEPVEYEQIHIFNTFDQYNRREV